MKLRRAAPRRVLATLIGQHLARLTVLGNAALERLDDQTRFLVMRHRPRHEVARVVVHEADEVDALIAPQLEREDVALPHLVRLGAFEPPLRLVTPLDLFAFRKQAGFVQDAAHRRLRDAQPLEARQHVPDPARTPFGIGCARRHDRGRRRVGRRLRLPTRRRSRDT